MVHGEWNATLPLFGRYSEFVSIMVLLMVSGVPLCPNFGRPSEFGIRPNSPNGASKVICELMEVCSAFVF